MHHGKVDDAVRERPVDLVLDGLIMADPAPTQFRVLHHADEIGQDLVPFGSFGAAGSGKNKVRTVLPSFLPVSEISVSITTRGRSTTASLATCTRRGGVFRSISRDRPITRSRVFSGSTTSCTYLAYSASTCGDGLGVPPIG